VAFVALLDASVLHPWVVCDLLLRLAERGLYRPAWSGEILDELVGSLTRRQPDHEEQFRRRRERMEAAFAEAMTHQPGRFTSAVPDEVDPGDRHVVAAAFAARADVIVTNNVRHFAPDRLAEVGLLVHTADEFLVHQWWLDPAGVLEELAAMAASTSRPSLTAAQVLESLRRFAPEFVGLVERASSSGPGPTS
jgi:predicted nucleic acid-binding protein